MTGIGFSAVILVITLALLVVLSMRDVPLWVVAVVCTIVLGLCTEEGPIGILAGSFSTGAASMFTNLAVVYMCGSLFAYVLTASGCGDTIAKFLVKKMGAQSAPYILMLCCLVLAFGGISAYPFILAPIAFSLLRAADLPRTVATVVFCGSYSLVGFLIPGTTLTTNVAVSNMLGTSLFAGADVGIVMFVVGLVLNILYYWWMCKRFKAQGVGYTPTSLEADVKDRDENDLPSFGVAVLPIIIAFGGAFVFQLGLGWGSTPTTIVSQGLAILVIFIFNWKRLPKAKVAMIGKGMQNSFTPLMIACCVAAFGSCMKTTSIYGAAIDLLSGMNMHPYVITVVCVMILAFLMAGAMPALMAFIPSIGQTLVAQGANAGIIHRLAMAAGTTFDSMPWSASLIINFNVMDVTIREAYKHVVVVQIVITTIYTLVGLAYALIFH